MKSSRLSFLLTLSNAEFEDLLASEEYANFRNNY